MGSTYFAFSFGPGPKVVWSALTRSNEHSPSVQVRAVFALHLQRASAPLREPRAHRRTGLHWAANPDQARAGRALAATCRRCPAGAQTDCPSGRHPPPAPQTRTRGERYFHHSVVAHRSAISAPFALAMTEFLSAWFACVLPDAAPPCARAARPS